MVIQMKYSKFLPVFLPVFLLCHSLIFAGEDYVPEMLEGTQKLREYSTYLRALDRAERLAIDIKNGNFLKELFGDFGRPELPEEIFRKYEIFDKLKTDTGNILNDLDTVMELYPNREEINKAMSLNMKDIGEVRDKLLAWRTDWMDRVDNALSDSFGMSLSRFEKVRETREEVVQYFKDLQSHSSGTNSLLEVRVEQQRYMHSLVEDALIMSTSVQQAIMAVYERDQTEDTIARERWENATNVKGWDEGESPNSGEIKAHWKE